MARIRLARDRIAGCPLASGPANRLARFRRSERVFAFCRDLLRSRSRSPADPPLPWEFSLKIPNGSQTESPNGQDRLGDSTTAPAPLRPAIRTGHQPIPRAGEPVPAPGIPRLPCPRRAQPGRGDGTPVIVSGGLADHTMRVWRIADGTSVGNPLTGIAAQ